MHVPKLNELYVTLFCQTINQNQPVIVPLQPLAGEPADACFSIVPKHIVGNGGKQVVGWTIWEWRGVMIEAEFHCVWQNPAGSLVDVTPKAKEFNNIVFLPDPQKEYRGRQVNNIRKPLNGNPAIQRFIGVSDQMFIEMNKGALADYHGPIKAEGKLLELYQEKLYLEAALSHAYGRGTTN